jgi:hypothetical protein
MMKIFGSQTRATLIEAGYKLVGRPAPRKVLLEDVKTGKREIWIANNRHSGYTVRIGRWGYEFVHDFKPR